MTEEELKRYQNHIKALLTEQKELVLDAISDEDLIDELGRRLKAERMAIVNSAKALKGGMHNGWN